jgi:hypothetical protein
MTRTDIIQVLIDRFELKSYLEIGVFKGENFDKIRCDLKHSVDPNHPATYEMTSDMYFFHFAIKLDWWDFIFVDGLHTEEQTYDDIRNAFHHLNNGGFIVVHDCNPSTKWHTRPESEYKTGEEWNGTTYRGFIRFKNEHPELTCFTVDADYGCGIITDRPLLKNEVFDNDWEYFDRNRVELLQLTSVERFEKLI